MAEGPYEIADMAQDALALADALELDTFHLVGVSMGGAIAQEVALAAPERVRTLTLAVTFAGRRRLGPQADRGVGRALCKDVAREARGRADAPDLLGGVLREREGAAWMRDMMLQDPHPQPPDAFIRQLEASSRHDARDRLPSLRCPTHVIGAERDILVPVWKSQELAELIPDAKLTVLPGARRTEQTSSAPRSSTPPCWTSSRSGLPLRPELRRRRRRPARALRPASRGPARRD